MALHNITTIPQTRWEIDPEHTTITFSMGQHRIHRVRGQFHDVHGWVLTSGEEQDEVEIRAEVDAASVDTRVKTRDRHLRSARFLDVERYPTIIFTGTAVEKLGGHLFRLAGDLTVRGITQPVEFEAAVEEGDTGPRIVAHAAVDRRAFKIGPWAMTLIAGDRVTLEIEATLHADVGTGR
jgi:polyisoprenoid-binding protein YceI